MNKALTSLLALTLTAGLAACSTAPEATTTNTTTTTTADATTAAGSDAAETTLPESEADQGALAGGWTINTENSLTSMPQKVASAWYGAVTDDKYMPVALLGTQVVAGTNYMFLARDNNACLYTVVIYADLQDNYSILKEIPFDLIAMLSDNGSTTPTGLAGGFTVNTDTLKMVDISAEDRDTFTRALSSSTDVTYMPITVIATQVVAGQNIAYLATGTPSAEGAMTDLYIVSIYKDLENNVSVNNICAINLAMLTE
ncbi:MAG: hypothetical protein MJ084_05520 [Saccharofermentans sp.]|nr:hypothetical protein [Saccharofermentans sp.]